MEKGMGRKQEDLDSGRACNIHKIFIIWHTYNNSSFIGRTIGWTCIWSRTIQHAWSVSTKILDSIVFHSNLTPPSLHIYITNFRGIWTKRNCTSGRNDCTLGNRSYFCNVCLIHSPSILASTKQARDYYSIVVHILLSWLLTIKFDFFVIVVACQTTYFYRSFIFFLLLCFWGFWFSPLLVINFPPFLIKSEFDGIRWRFHGVPTYLRCRCFLLMFVPDLPKKTLSFLFYFSFYKSHNNYEVW